MVFRNALTSNTDEGSELQTDAMRFVAILALCLMAIFSLLQSIPVQPTRSAPSIPASFEPDRQRLSQQKRAAQELEAKLLALNADTHAAEARNRRANQKLMTSRQQLAATIERTSKLRAQRAYLAQEMQLLAHRIEQRRSTRNPSAVISKVEQNRGNPQAGKPALHASANHSPPTTPSENTGLSNKHFTLRFASATALNQLVQSDQVSVLTWQNNKFWRLGFARGQPALEPAIAPKTFHQMQPETVPTPYLEALSELSAQDRSKASWIIVLPARIEDAIKTLVQTQKGGDIVIQADGRLTLDQQQ